MSSSSKQRTRGYEGDEIVVEYDPKRCIHSAECVRGLRDVFDPDRAPWIDPGRGDADVIAEVIERCPTGALHYRRKDDGDAERPDVENVARVDPHGPVFVRGRIRIELPDGDVVADTRVALCRCGASDDKPFCDGSHEEIGFDDAGAIRGGRLVPADEAGGVATDAAVETEPADDDADRTVTFSCAPGGPLLVRGPLRVEGADGSVSEGVRGALCRCGHSDTKPFCDGSHRDVGFTSD